MRGCQVVFVSHDIGQAKRISDHIIFLVKGKLNAHQKTQDFFLSPNTRHAESFLRGELIV